LAPVSEAIRNTVAAFRERNSPLKLTSWEELDIPGRFIIEEVLSSIDDADILMADISRLNFNVTYEIGYAIGKKKRILLIKNKAIRQDGPRIEDLGIFDTIGYQEYSSSTELVDFLKNITDHRAIPYSEHRNSKAPLYLLETKFKTDVDYTITSRIKKTRFYFRSFDPAEIPRLSATEAINQVAESYGVIVHFISPEQTDAPLNNLRAAFIAGLSDGMERKGLFIQSGEGPVPIDYRDFVAYCRYPDQFKEEIAGFAEIVTEALQEVLPIVSRNSETLLQALDLGASSAENEITSLAEYYVEIDAFNRALRKEVRLVTGRKGSGKTAIFYRLRDSIRANRANVVLDLKPEGYQLLKFKDAVVNLMSLGTVEHTITAFWEYLLWLEICYKLIEKDREIHKRDHRLFEPYQRLLAAYRTDSYSSEGDFAERLRVLLRDIRSEIDTRFADQRGVELSRPEITELVYRHDFSTLKSQIEDYLEFKGEVWLLFDNIDKGWPSQGVTKEDLVIVRALLEATRKIERELQKKSLDAHTVIFLRNDIYEILVDSTADRGKETRVNVDWTDPDMLREMIRRRIVRGFPEAMNADFEDIWRKICDPIIDGEESSQYLIDRSLMRPRSLIELIGHCRGFAVNLGHDRILKEDVLPPKGLSAFSNDLVNELGLEIRDVFPEAEDVLYAFIGAPSRMDRQTLLSILAGSGFTEGNLEAVIDLLFWFGFLGFIWTDGETRFIYSFSYSMQVLRGSHKKLLNTGITYVINPAFISALGVQHSEPGLI
jgi:hypothetical protein